MGYRIPQPPPLICACQFGQPRGPLRSVWRGAPERCSPGLPRPAPPPTESGEGHARARARHPRRGFEAALLWARAALDAARRGVWGGAARPPTPPASPRRAALRPLPSRAAAGGRRAGTGWGRLARGCRSPGCGCFPSRDRTAGERERRTPSGGVSPSAAPSSRGGPPAEGAGQRPGSREGGRGRSASRASRGRPRVWRWDPRAFSRRPALRPRPFHGVPGRAPAPFPRGASRLARGLLAAAADSPLRVRELTEAGLSPRGCRPRPLHRGRTAAPHGGASLGAR